jgi:hypothetical protein
MANNAVNINDVIEELKSADKNYQGMRLTQHQVSEVVLYIAGLEHKVIVDESLGSSDSIGSITDVNSRKKTDADTDVTFAGTPPALNEQA